MSNKNTETTRYLCAAAYSNEAFCEQVIQQTIEQEYRAIAPCYGFDLPTVIKHCLIAKKRRKKRDLIFTSIFTIWLILSLYEASWSLALLLILLFVTWIIIFRERLITRHTVVLKYFSEENYDPDYIDWEAELNDSQNNLDEDFHDDKNREKTKKIKAIINKIVEEQSGKIILYGKYSPFIGAGYDIGGWSFALDITKPKTNLEKTFDIIPFTIKELYQEIENDVNKIELPEIEIKIEDNLYVNGKKVRDDKRFLNSPFKPPYVNSNFASKKLESEKSNRYYKRIQITGWNGELIFSIFLRFFIFGNNLFLEAKYFLLPPLKETFYAINKIETPGTIVQKIDLAWQSIMIAIFILPISFSMNLYQLIKPTVLSINRWLNTLMIKENPTYNYGSITSVRENASNSLYREYFQILDKDMYLKVFETILLNSMVDFLDSKNIDTTDLKNRQSEIINHGIIMSGGSINSKNLAVGRRARAISKKFKRIRISNNGASKSK